VGYVSCVAFRKPVNLTMEHESVDHVFQKTPVDDSKDNVENVAEDIQLTA